MRTMTFTKFALASIAAAFLFTGCEFQEKNTATDGDGIGPVGEGGGFLWKPVSESTGKLVVILPPQYTGLISGCYVASPEGVLIEGGNFSAVANGGREHFRYSKPGGAYPGGSHAVAILKAGGSVHWTVPNTGSRTTY